MTLSSKEYVVETLENIKLNIAINSHTLSNFRCFRVQIFEWYEPQLQCICLWMSVQTYRITTPWFETRLVGKFRLKYGPNKNFRTGFRWISDSKRDEFLHVHTRQSSSQNNKYQVSYKHSCFSWWWAHSRPKRVEIDKYTKRKYTNNKSTVCWMVL